jgi:hypothetical protein
MVTPGPTRHPISWVGEHNKYVSLALGQLATHTLLAKALISAGVHLRWGR